MESKSNTVRVKLSKSKKDGFGFLVQRRESKPHVVVSDLIPGGLAVECGLISRGDIVVRLNDTYLTDIDYEKAVFILRSAPIGHTATLLLRAPDGFTTHLVTTFDENGVGKTIRVTSPFIQNDSFISRIKRSFSRGQSPIRLCNAEAPSDTLVDPTAIENSNNFSSAYSSDLTLGSHDKCSIEMEPNEPINKLISNVNSNHNNMIQSPKIYLTNAADDKHQSYTNVTDNNSRSVSNTIPSSPGNANEPCEQVDKDHREIKYVNTDKEATTAYHMKENESVPTPKRNSVATNRVENTTSDENRRSKMDSPKNYPTSESYSPGSRRSSLAVLTGIDGQKVSGERRSSQLKKFMKLRNLADESRASLDTLHSKVIDTVPCTPDRCLGSVMAHMNKRPPGVPRCKEEVLLHARDFIEQYYTSIKRLNTPAHLKRLQKVSASIEKIGTYELTSSELTFGAKTSWRNAPRCIGRIQWSKLQVFDARHITTARGMFEAICNHIRYGTNKGNIRSAITIFPPRTDGKHDYRIWNAQFIRYAGYRQPDGSIVGDPMNIEFTEICEQLGWKPKSGMFDLLPLVLQANGHDPEMFEIPRDLVIEVPLIHPQYPWFAELNLKWYALPAVSMMVFDCGGLEFTAAPFNGWYMGTEIGARNFCDISRYHFTGIVAQKMGLDTRKSSSLWKDRVLVEINIAVLYSYQVAGVTITDHHAAAESFMKFAENEQRLRGGYTADWVWVVPPMSGSLTPVFHQEMLMYKMKPSYEYQEDPWKTHVWMKDRDKKTSDRPKRKFRFRELARAVKFSAKLMGRALARRVKCVILYATETGKSERFARMLCEIFKHAFDARVMCMEEYDVIDLEHEAMVLVVTSTFGNGDPPESGEQFAKDLYELKSTNGRSGDLRKMSYIRMSVSSEPEDSQSISNLSADDNLQMEAGPLSNVRYSVFGLGSRAYPKFCAFAYYMDNVFNQLGADRICKLAEGDELCGQEESFRQWAKKVFEVACETFCVGNDFSLKDATSALAMTDYSWSPDKFRLTPVDNEKEPDLCEALSQLNGKHVLQCRLLQRTQLQSPKSSRQTFLMRLDITQSDSELSYLPGDHVAIFPANSAPHVDAILRKLQNAPDPDQLIRVEVLQEKNAPLGAVKGWTTFKKIPLCTLRTALTRFLDITTPPSQTMLKLFSTQANRELDKEELEHLGTDLHAYEDWKYKRVPTLAELLDEFPSLRLSPTLLLSQLPTLQQRFYSISSSPKAYPGEIHATVSVMRYKPQMEHEGVCSNWLNRLEAGDTIPCLVRAAPTFHLPEDGTLPIIMVGPGTGIAPFRSFWQQRKIDKEMLKEPSNGNRQGWGQMYLYFGCREIDIDNIYSAELKSAMEEGVLKEFYVAQSRNPSMRKMYVQDVLMQNSKAVCDALISRGGHFYICGDVQMASDVTRTLQQILQKEAAMDSSHAMDYILQLRDSNRFHEDIFGVTMRSTEVTDRARDQAKKAWIDKVGSSIELERSSKGSIETGKKD
ncbi:hypothetical protein ScPMuIL_006114 [Solemya velum]